MICVCGCYVWDGGAGFVWLMFGDGNWFEERLRGEDDQYHIRRGKMKQSYYLLGRLLCVLSKH